MKTLTQLQKQLNKPTLSSNDILNFAPEIVSESNTLNELVAVLKKEIKNQIISNINHLLR